MKSLNLD